MHSNAIRSCSTIARLCGQTVMAVATSNLSARDSHNGLTNYRIVIDLLGICKLASIGLGELEDPWNEEPLPELVGL